MQITISKEEHFLIFQITKSLYPFLYFDLTKQKTDIKDGVTRLAFHCELSAVTAENYVIYGIIIHEEEAEIEKQGGKRLLRG